MGTENGLEKDAQPSNRFGAFGGVFTPCILTILGVILFMRADFVIGQAGIFNAILILCVAKSLTLFTALSASAIATNMRVRGGGAYFLISRVLGPEFGGGIGVVLFLAQAVSVPFYILGFTEALIHTFQPLQPHAQVVALVTAAVLFVVTYIGASWAIRVQYFIMAALVLSVVAFLGGAFLRFSPETFAANWTSAYTPITAGGPEGHVYSFWLVFAIYFPAATGIMAGINMSGDLKDPAHAIPRGVLAAIVVGFLVYLTQIVLCGGAFDRDALVTRPYLSLKENALFGTGVLVTAGMFAATLSSALGSFMGAPRVLQALARDRILPFIRPFAKGAPTSDEPRPALLLTGALTFLVLLWAGKSPGGHALNLVAKTITMFFLYTYGMLNISAFIEAAGGNPSFRPRFRFFHWTSALAGGLGCIAVAFVISPAEAVAAILLLAALVWHLHRRALRMTFGDARRGFLYKAARNSLLTLYRMPETPKNWRPTGLVFSGNPEIRETLVNYALWFEAGQGIVFLANVIVGEIEDRLQFRTTAVKKLKDFCQERDIPAFPVVVIDEDLEHGMAGLMQAVSVGPIRPNLAVFGWSDKPERIAASIRQYRTAQAMGMSLVVIDPGPSPADREDKRIDIWWRGMKNGGLMVLLAHLLTRNVAWEHSRLRLLRHVDSQAAYEGTRDDLQTLIRNARVDATVEVVVSEKPFDEVLKQESAGADCIIMGLEVPESGQETLWYSRYLGMICPGATNIFVCSTGAEDLMA